MSSVCSGNLSPVDLLIIQPGIRHVLVGSVFTENLQLTRNNKVHAIGSLSHGGMSAGEHRWEKQSVFNASVNPSRVIVARGTMLHSCTVCQLNSSFVHAEKSWNSCVICNWLHRLTNWPTRFFTSDEWCRKSPSRSHNSAINSKSCSNCFFFFKEAKEVAVKLPIWVTLMLWLYNLCLSRGGVGGKNSF